MNTRNCEKCNANYSTGKEYENMWCVLPDPRVETKGLCEQCNPKSDCNQRFNKDRTEFITVTDYKISLQK